MAFGILNLLALGVLAGWPVAAAALGFALASWLACQGVRSLRPDPLGPVGRGLILALLSVPVLLFLLHKLNVDYRGRFWTGADPGAAPPDLRVLLHLGEALAFSYVVLRYLEMAHAVVGHQAALLDPLSTAGYLFPFHMILSGPIGRYDEHLRMNDGAGRAPVRHGLLLALNDITTGLFYKYVLSDYIRVFAFGPEGALASASWLDTGLLFVYTFFDFAGYSRIVLGAGRLMGVPTPVNFNRPFLATTVTDFFTRWHMSLGTWIQRNVYMPLQMFLVRRWGVRRAFWAGLIALLTGWLVVGLWHRLSGPFLVYGIGMALLLWSEKWGRDRLLKTRWSKAAWAKWTARLVGPVYVFVVVTSMLNLIIAEMLRS